MSDLLDLLGEEWAAPTWAPLYLTGDDRRMCRDCGRTAYSWKHGCGGAGREGIYNLCDDCAALDGRGQRHDGHTNASRWRIVTIDHEAARLDKLQSSRRALYIRALPTSSAGG